MTAAAVSQQLVAGFALHALWQVPALAVATWLALHIAKPGVRTAHAAWVVTLLLSVCAPAAATWQGYHEAQQQGEAALYLIHYGSEDAAGAEPHMARDAAWLRLLHRHLSARDGATPFLYRLPEWLARDIAAAYLLLLVLACVRLALSVQRARVLRRSSSRAVPQDIADVLAGCATRMGCAMPVVACSAAVAGPLLAGFVRPVLLLPEWAATLTAEEMNAVLTHELAHVQRHDPAAHAVYSLLLLPVQFHPVAGWIASRIRQTREMACDAAAVEQMGSRSRYAHALLRVAERVVPLQCSAVMDGLGLFDTAASVRDGRLQTATQAATAGLELFGAQGAMEERMHRMMMTNETTTVAARVVRRGVAMLIVAAGVTAAWSVRVQPALAAQIPLASASNAQQQLKAANSKLQDAAVRATTEDARKKIGAAQQAIHMAESELAAQSAPASYSEVDSTFQSQMDALQKTVNSPEFKAQIEKQRIDAEAMRAQFESPAFKARIEKQRANAEAMRAQFESPEFKATIQKQTEDARRVAAQWNSPEFKARIEKQRADAEAMRVKFESPEFKAQIQKQMEDAALAMQHAKLQLQMMAKNETLARPDAVPEDTPIKVPSSEMAARTLLKQTPVYPVSAKEAKLQGEVVLRVLIDEHGAVEKMQLVSSPDEAFTKSAMDAVKHWTYQPYVVAGKPTAVESTVTVHYTLAQ